MKLFKTVDEKLAEIGFVKEEEDKYGCVYKRKDKEYNFTQKVFIGHKKSGGHILHSYDPDLVNMETSIVFHISGVIGKKYPIFVSNGYAIGFYSTKAKAMKVLDMIQEAYANFEASKIISTGLTGATYTGSYDTPENVAAGIKVLKDYTELIRESVAFQMPEDSEVEA